MKNVVHHAWFSGVTRTALAFFVGIALAASLWTATARVANGREMSANEMLQAKLPASRTLANATGPEILKAVCGAVGSWRRDAGQIVREAIAARRAPARDVVSSAIRCMRDGKEGALDCSLVADIYNAARSADPNDAAAFLDEIVGLAPDCRGALGQTGDVGEFTNTPVNVNPPPGSIGGGATRGLCQVCHNGHEIRIPCDEAAKFIRHHPGDKAGPCQPTPTTNQ